MSKYKLKQFWIRRHMWSWCFDCWFKLMYPHIFYAQLGGYDKFDTEDDNWWFWMILNNFDGDLEER